MKRLILLIIFLFGCQTPTEHRDELRKQISVLTQQKNELEVQLTQLRQQTSVEQTTLATMHGLIDGLKANAAVLQAEKDRKKIHCIVKLSLRQVSYSLSISKQIKDSINEEEFELPIDCDTYDHVNIGTNLFDGMRAGSAIIYGSLGSWRLKVTNKRMVIDP